MLAIGRTIVIPGTASPAPGLKEKVPAYSKKALDMWFAGFDNYFDPKNESEETVYRGSGVGGRSSSHAVGATGRKLRTKPVFSEARISQWVRSSRL
jgi:hypothetical protein